MGLERRTENIQYIDVEQGQKKKKKEKRKSQLIALDTSDLVENGAHDVNGEGPHAVDDQAPSFQKKEKKRKKRKSHLPQIDFSSMKTGEKNGEHVAKKRKNFTGSGSEEVLDGLLNVVGGAKYVNGASSDKKKSGMQNGFIKESKHDGKVPEKKEKDKKLKRSEATSLKCTDKASLPADNNFEKKTIDVSNSRITGNDEHLQVRVSGKDAENDRFQPLETFSEVRVPKNVMECCKGFQKPSPIQAHAWPFLLDGRDLIGIAATGSGKTLAFGVPALFHVLSKSTRTMRQNRPTCLVLSPTRELAQQISEVLVEAGHSCGVKAACFYGGTSKKPQYTALKTGVDIIVATPGRLQDLVEEGCCSLQEVSFVVLDEADRMLDLGFEEVVRTLVGQTMKSRQTIMFSATWPSAVDELATEFMRSSPIKVIVGSQDLAANHSVTQVVEVIDAASRDARLFALLKEYHKSESNRILVFVLYKKEAARVENMLQRRGLNACAVHGDKAQFDRNKAVMAFKDGTCPLLIATDVAARGLDIPDVKYVINYSFPLTTEDYVHRIGRTGRAGKSGVAHTFFTHADKARAGELVNVLREAGQTVPLELLKFGTSVKKKESKLYGAHFKDIAIGAAKATKITFDSDDD